MKPFLLFAAGGAWFGAPAESSAEVLALGAVTPVPGAPPHLAGVVAHRGEVIPVVDLGRLFKGQPGHGRRAVVLRAAGGVVGVLATEVLGVRSIDDHLLGTVAVEGREVTLIEPDALLVFLKKAAAR
jgi:purine-binding chemotaxis protein CheW